MFRIVNLPTRQLAETRNKALKRVGSMIRVPIEQRIKEIATLILKQPESIAPREARISSHPPSWRAAFGAPTESGASEQPI
jgi:hypothetical protein